MNGLALWNIDNVLSSYITMLYNCFPKAILKKIIQHYFQMRRCCSLFCYKIRRLYFFNNNIPYISARMIRSGAFEPDSHQACACIKQNQTNDFDLYKVLSFSITRSYTLYSFRYKKSRIYFKYNLKLAQGSLFEYI